MTKQIESHLKEDRELHPTETFVENAGIGSYAQYEEMYRRSIENPNEFWAEQAQTHLEWFKPWDSVLDYDFEAIGTKAEPYLSYFSGGELNVSYNCLDRHLKTWRRNKAAIIWQGEDRSQQRTLTYQELHRQVCRFANVLKKHGVKKGTRVTLYMPMIPELPIAMLACARIGAIHSVVFSAFSAEALRGRVNDCGSKVVVTCDQSRHHGRSIPLKANVDEALYECPTVEAVIVFNNVNGRPDMKPGRDVWWHEEMYAADVDPYCPAESLESETPLFILYTSGSTGKPKGVVHTSAGYLLYTHLTFQTVFDIRDDDIFWCTADIGWITGHSYVVYGPLSNGATVLMFEGAPNYPTPDRFWEVIEDYRVSIFYTAPTALRSLMKLGDDHPNSRDLSSLRLLGSVGEPINPEAWLWYYRVIGKERCPIVDTWWQTETGGIMITTLPGAMSMKPGAAGKPLFGVVPAIYRDDMSPTGKDEGGNLVITQPWPGMLRGVFGDDKHERIKRNYFSNFPGRYLTGDGCRVDADGYYWLMGRLDDVINVSAHRFSTAEIESALVSHSSVAEAAVVGVPHDTKGQGIYCFVTLKQSHKPSEDLRKILIGHVRREIGPIATPETIHFAPALPKTRSGKIMRRILRKIAEGSVDEIGDVSTLADPSVVEQLLSTKG